MAKNYNLNAGIRVQKSIGFYCNNGVAAEFSSPHLFNQKLTLGMNLLSSRLGSAFLNHGIAYHEIQISALHYFRSAKRIQPLVRLNTGLAFSRYGSSVFRDIPASSLLLSAETGVGMDMNKQLKFSFSAGYNAITGNGTRGFGMVWPIFVQFSALYRFGIVTGV
ncbi:MAG: hypothetical protein JNL57_04475 [Bacteroidetes bacterium]|nr:hypothetical protein [Bacteroidota bacterium]